VKKGDSLTFLSLDILSYLFVWLFTCLFGGVDIAFVEMIEKRKNKKLKIK
jgi:hypothetical protein